MKILLINDYSKKFGGAERVVFDTKKLLEEKGYIVKIFPSNEKENLTSFFSRWFSVRYYYQTEKLIKKFQPDIIHCHSLYRIISPSPLLVAKKYGIPVILTFHDFHMVCPKTWMIYKNRKSCKYGFGWRCLVSNCFTQKMGIINFPYHWLKWQKVWLHREILKRYVDYFICPSKILTVWTKQSLRVKNVSYIPNFIDIKIKESKRIDSFEIKPNQFLFVGRLSKEKGVDVLIRAIKEAKGSCPEILVNVIGDGSEKENLEKLTEELKLQNNIKFLGRIPNEKLFQYYQESLAVVMPSVWMENNPIVALEAMANKTPIIASNIGGFPDLVEDGKNGYLFEMGNYKELAKYIKKLYNNIEFSKILGEFGFRKVKREFNKEKYYKKLIEIYRGIIEKK